MISNIVTLVLGKLSCCFATREQEKMYDLSVADWCFENMAKKKPEVRNQTYDFETVTSRVG
jgi:hypothetical protein